MGISIGGLVSGMDTEKVISQLMDIEKKPVTKIQNKQSDYQVQLSAYSSLQSSLSSVKSTAQNLASKDNVTSFFASSGNSGLLTASAGSGAIAGNYSVTVNALASVQKLNSGAFSQSEFVGEGTIHLAMGAGASVDIAVSATATISDVAGSINAAGAGISANVIFDGTSYFLTLTGKMTGASNTVSLTVTEAGTALPSDPLNQDMTGLSRLVYDSAGATKNLTQIQAANDADISVDGIVNIKRSSNTIDDAISGVTLSLKTADVNSTVTVSVDQDNSLLTTRMNAFISAYNNLADTLNNLQSYDPKTQKTGALFGDSTVRRIQSQLRNLITGSVPGLPEGSNRLSDMGIKITNTDALSSASKLELNAAVFNAKIKDNFDAVSNFFSSTTKGSEGFSSRMVTSVQTILDTNTGTLTVRTKGIQKSIDTLGKRVDTMNARITANETRMRAQFSSLEVLLGQFKNQADSLTQQLAQLENNWYSNNK
jgi:flagellar hook-associated protein 2